MQPRSSRSSWALALLLPVLASTPGGADEPPAGGHWPQFRGPRASGVADGRQPPVSWDAPKGRNVLWRTPIPGLAHSSPIVWGERVFLTTAVSSDPDPKLRVGLYGDIAPVVETASHSFRVLALDRKSGKLLWEQTAHEGVPRIKRHTKSTHANSTPATDGRRVVAAFGSEGLFAYDPEGKPLWKRDLGLLDSGFYRVPAAQWGFGSSPVIHGDLVIVQCDVQKDSFVAALRLADGADAWRTPRRDAPTWSTPTIVDAPGGAQVVLNGYLHAGGYELRSGKEVWKLSGGGDIPVPTPVAAGGLVFLSSAHGMQAPLSAVRLTAAGDVSLKDGATANEHVAWSRSKDGIYMQTPIAYGERLYACRDNGVLSCYAASTGERLWRERLGGGAGGFTASPVAADGRLYFTGEEGEVYVVKDGAKFELLATSPLGEVCMATPAIAERMLLVRTRSAVYALGESPGE